MSDWQRAPAQNPMTAITTMQDQQQGGINTSGRIYGGTATSEADTSLIIVPTNEKGELSGEERN